MLGCVRLMFVFGMVCHPGPARVFGFVCCFVCTANLTVFSEEAANMRECFNFSETSVDHDGSACASAHVPIGCIDVAGIAIRCCEGS